MTVYLKDLYLGEADGSSESTKERFLDLFYTGNNKYNEITNNPLKFIISGQKGTGKTILGNYIRAKYIEKSIICEIFSKSDIDLIKLLEKGSEKINNEEVIQFYKYYIYYEIFKLIKDIKIHFSIKFNKSLKKEIKKKREYKKAIKNLEKLFSDRYTIGTNYEVNGYNKIDESSLLGEVSVDGTKKRKLQGVDKNVTNSNYIKKEFYKIVEEIEKNLVKCLKVNSVVIILDDLDELDIKINCENSYVNSINKLIEALKSINILFNKRKVGPSKCILLIRSDIMNVLNKYSSNLNKVLLDNTVELYWIDKMPRQPHKHMLMEMILNKIKKTCPEYSNMGNKELYNKLFPKDIGGYTAVDYMINNSFGRPRDIFCYLNIITNKYPNDVSFQRHMFRECKQAYSKSFLDELYNQMKIHLDVKIADEYIELLRNFGKNTFYFSELKKYYKLRRKSYPNISDLNKCLSDLYDFGVVGNCWKVKEQLKYSWGYRRDGKDSISIDQKFTIHYALRKTLDTN